MENLEPWYVSLNPEAVVPTLDHAGHCVTDSLVILRTIDRRFVGPGLVPGLDEDRAVMDHWLTVQDELPLRALVLGQTTGLARRMAFGALRRRRSELDYLAQSQESVSEIASTKSAALAELERVSLDPERSSQLLSEVMGRLDELEERLRTSRWLAGRDYSLADVTWTVVIARLDLAGLLPQALGSRPALAQWYTRVMHRPSFWQADVTRRRWPYPFLGMLVTSAVPRVAVGVLGILGVLFIYAAING
jgi:tetrachloro-p-hydroquinone reductive dehalogenase